MNYYVLLQFLVIICVDLYAFLISILCENVIFCYFDIYIPVFWNFHGRSGRNLSKIGPIDVPKHDPYPHLHLHGDNSRQIPYI